MCCCILVLWGAVWCLHLSYWRHQTVCDVWSPLTKSCYSSGSASPLFTPSHAQRVSGQACAWFCSSLPYSHAELPQVYLSSSTRNAEIHWHRWGFVLEKLICHKTWNKARGSFFIRFLLHKMWWITGGKIAFYDKSFPSLHASHYF